jgi:phosphoribosylamine--glycine ligase
MKVLVIGSGGREHAICEAFSSDSKVQKIFCISGNAGISTVAECVAIKPEDISSIAEFAEKNGIEITFVGGEGPLAAGIVDEFSGRGLPIVGPSKSAARLETSKVFAKDFMKKYGIPTAEYFAANSTAEAIKCVRSKEQWKDSAGIVVKADGLAAGKGVVVTSNQQEAEIAINTLEKIAGSEASRRIVLEERLEGKELSLLLFTDGDSYSLMPPARDHKRLKDADCGPNTGGMGTITDSSLIDEPTLKVIEEKIVKRTLEGAKNEGLDYKGILFIGMMLTKDGPKVLEYNVRFGDPETQSILVRLNTSLLEISKVILDKSLSKLSIDWKQGSSATVILAAEGYPQNPRKGDKIEGLEAANRLDGINIFHSGTAFDESGNFITAGGRVLGVTACGENLDEALARAYGAAHLINWPGMQMRNDIGRATAG